MHDAGLLQVLQIDTSVQQQCNINMRVHMRQLSLILSWRTEKCSAGVVPTEKLALRMKASGIDNDFFMISSKFKLKNENITQCNVDPSRPAPLECQKQTLKATSDPAFACP